MKKFLCLLLIALIFGSISCGAQEEWNKTKKVLSEVKKFLQKYGIYDQLVSFFNKSAKGGAQKLCVKVIKLDKLCTNIINVLWKLLENYYGHK